MTRDEMLRAVDQMNIYEKDYNTLLNLMNNADDKFFIKALEGIFNGELFIEDFERIFVDDAYANVLEQNFRTQLNLKNEVERLLEYRYNTLGETLYTIDNIQGNLAIVRPTEGEDYDGFYDTISEEIRDDLMYQILYTTERDSDIVRESKIKLLEKFQSGELNKQDLLLFTDSLIIPLSYEHQVLNQLDNEFMIENKTSEQKMKKLKALAMFLRTKYEGGV